MTAEVALHGSFCSSTDVKARHSLPNVDRHRVGSYFKIFFFLREWLAARPETPRGVFPPPLFFLAEKRQSILQGDVQDKTDA